MTGRGLANRVPKVYTLGMSKSFLARRYTCKVCGHEWYPRGPGKPLRCSKCKSPYWNKPRDKKVSERVLA
jgi:predicted Zn-ribbon and HTH transcriptional regulator